ncbi:hypothetical protein AMK68_01815 [candidate division KD3-62 bacterium DG_56]|uniref:Xylulose kinase n=1 Tax=candidate division KD3-62 bacterium DG_56 TaxID=1704032 RepID=A0A0S7XPD0_9BACT|nr:MAG: hypothetical protein AMK68_01815 [candidate division KD3-62 bacterium DG_56]
MAKVSKPPYVLGIDSGTQSLRAGIFDLKGNCLASAVQEYPISIPRVSWAEQSPDDWWQAARSTVRQCLAESEANPGDIAGASVDGTACTVVLCKRNGTPLRPGILWMDVRAHQEAERITATGADVLKYVGNKESAEWMVPKAMWLKTHEPQVYDAAEVVCESTDWLTFRLTGRWTASLCNTTCKWNYARPAGGWPEALLREMDMAELLGKWPRDVLAMGEPQGELTQQAAQELGLPAGLPVAEGGIDAYTGMFGLAVTRPGRMALVMGSSTCHMALSERAIFGSGVWGPYPDALIPGTWVLEGGQTATGSIVKWFRDNFAAGAKYDELDRGAAAVPPGSEGLVMLDYFQGNRTPIRDPLVRGAIWGLSLKHTSAHVFRAVCEGTAYGTRHILQDLADHGFTATEIYACGGGAKSRLWLQIHADVCGVPIFLTAVPEATTLGSAICAAVGAGLYANPDEAAQNMVQVTSRIEPDAANREVYDFYFGKYLETYRPMAPLMHAVTERVEQG